MIGIAQCILLYALLLGSGVIIASRLSLRTLIGCILMIFAFGTAQLLLSIQFLSLFRQLNETSLLLLNIFVCAALWLALRKRPKLWRHDSKSRLVEGLSFAKANRLEASILSLAAASVLASSLVASFTYPFGDIYHYTMPLFWRQHASILPFPVHDPRVIGVVFGSEGVCFPGFLYARSGAICSVVSGAAALMSIWLVIAISRQLGASPRASTCAGAMIAGFGPVSVALFGAAADVLLSAMWFSASVYFLLASRRFDKSGPQSLELACSVFCLLLGCGTKNVVLLQGPSWLLAALLLHGRQLFNLTSLRTLVATGVLGLVASGVMWSYISNAAWFGDFRGGRELKDTVSTDMQPRAIWTRTLRAAVTTALDVIWLPSRWRESYSNVVVRTVRSLGGSDQLREDHGFYSFAEPGPRPGMGIGLLGPCVFIPGVLAPLFGCFLGKKYRASAPPAFPTAAVLALLTLGSFVTICIVLRWQSIGTTRLMTSALVAAVPLTALLLDRTWMRLPAMALLVACLGLYSFAGAGNAIWRLDLAERSPVHATIARLQNDHSLTVDYRWWDGRTGSLKLREDFTRRQIYEFMFTRMTQPTAIAFAGSFNTEAFYLFGEGFSNRVSSLVDSRKQQTLLPPPSGTQYVVLDESDFTTSERTLFNDFEAWLEVRQEGKPFFFVFKKRPVLSVSRPGVTASFNSNEEPFACQVIPQQTTTAAGIAVPVNVGFIR